MKRIIKNTIASSFTLAVLAAAVLQVAEPAKIWAQDDEECEDYAHAVCSVEEVRKCRFWIFFCEIESTTIYYYDVY